MTHRPTPRAVVVGSMNQDLVIPVEHLPVSGETLNGAELVSSPGGKGGNQAVALSRLGIPTAIVSRVGHDTIGVDLVERMEAESVDTSHVLPTREASSGVALIVVRSDGENMITVSGGANLLMSRQDVRLAEPLIASTEMLMVQLEIPLAATLEAVEIAHRAGRLITLNAAPLPEVIDAGLRELIAKVDILVLNRVEARQLLELTEEEAGRHDLCEAVRALRTFGPQVAVITLGAEGGIAAFGDDVLRVPVHPVKAVDGVGAGDAFCVGLAIATVEKRAPADALNWAAACGALATTQIGAQSAMPRRRDVARQIELSGLSRG